MTTATAITIGGSEAAAACGLDPFKSRVQLWAEKTGRVEPTEAGEAALWGTLLEPVIAAEVERRGYSVLPAPADPWREGFMVGHPDGFVTGVDAGRATFTINGSAHVFDTRGIFECKTTTAWNAQAWADDSIPSAYILQVQHYLHLTGLTWGLVACLIGGQRLELRTVEKDAGLIALMLEMEQEFVSLCELDTPPAPDGSKATDAILGKLYPEASGVVQLSEFDRQTVDDYRKLRAQGKKIERQMETKGQELKMRLGGAEVGLLDGLPVVRWSEVNSRRFDQSRFKLELPDVYEQHRKPSSYRRFTVTDA